jgi:hypothetical protein
MATFNGVFPAGELVQAPCGILSVADVMVHTARERDERWVRKFAYEFDSMPSYVRLLTVNDETVTNGELSDNQADNSYAYYVPFFIDAEIFDSTFSLPGEDRFKQVVKALECVTQKALEFEFWEGNAAQAETDANGNMYLRKSGAATIPVSGANAAASATNKWMYATSAVEVHLGKVEIVNENLAQGADVTINNMRIKAFRPAAAYADPSMLYAMRVTLPSD